MATIESFEDLDAWKLARVLTKAVYRITRHEPMSRDFGLRDQIQRSSVSVMANVAEGFESRTIGLFLEHLGRAKASAGEVRAHLFVARDVGYIDEHRFHALKDMATKTSACISGLMRYLKTKKDI